MTVPKSTTESAVVKQLEKLQAIPALGTKLIVQDQENQQLKFQVTARDKEVYYLLVVYDDYPLVPASYSFTKGDWKTTDASCWPVDRQDGRAGTVFHNRPVICHRVNRLCYKDYTNLHGEWAYADWRSEDVNDIASAIRMIGTRLNAPEYQGRRQA